MEKGTKGKGKEAKRKGNVEREEGRRKKGEEEKRWERRRELGGKEEEREMGGEKKQQVPGVNLRHLLDSDINLRWGDWMHE
ncbi:MAG: hypothetical protein IJL42_06655 [Bacteroidales bacterium]|nr:hypothetical protein [Bacteroidales bacterium]